VVGLKSLLDDVKKDGVVKVEQDIAVRLLAGLLANQAAVKARDWETTEVRRAVRLARLLLRELNKEDS
jgi:hypothetical protein